MRLHYGFILDTQRHPAMPSFPQPALIFHGTRDDVVPPACSERFAAASPNTRLRLLDSDHQLTDATEAIWAEAEPFLFGERIDPPPDRAA
jgi:hypothetical protein